MELPQARPFGTQGGRRRKATHDFLSLYSHSSAQQDPAMLPSSQGSNLKTQDLLQPLEGEKEKKGSSKLAKEEEAEEERGWVVNHEKPFILGSSMEVPAGGFGSYSMIWSNNNNNNNKQRINPNPKLLRREQASSTTDNSNCTSQSESHASEGGGLSLWEECAVNIKGKTGKENYVLDKPNSSAPDSAAKLGQWALSERTSQSYSNTPHPHNTFNALIPSSHQTTGQKNQSFIEMIKSVKDDYAEDEEVDNEEEVFILKKEFSNTQMGELRVKVEGKGTDQKPNTPRSKHSATEQRRRSKINDRFQMLRNLIPNSDQKRDKASFLLEVIEYIHFLQEKVHNFEGPYQTHEAEKLMPWRNNYTPAASYMDQSCGTKCESDQSPTLMFASKFDEKNVTISPAFPGCTQNVKSDMNPATKIKAIDQNTGITHEAMANPMELTATNDKLKEKELTIEGGAISISSVYSRGLLNTLTQALQSSGVDLSGASISVQIELGKQANITQSAQAPVSGAKEDELFSRNQRMSRSRVASTEDSDQALKKPKIRRS